MFQYPPEIDIKQKTNEEIFLETLDVRNLAVDIRSFDNAFFEEALKSRLSHPKSTTTLSAKSQTSAISVKSAKSQKSAKNVRIAEETKDSKTDGSTKADKPASATSQRTTSAKSMASSLTFIDDLNDKDEAVLAWNKTPFCVYMQKHVLRHKPTEKNVSIDVSKICAGDR